VIALDGSASTAQKRTGMLRGHVLIRDADCVLGAVRYRESSLVLEALGNNTIVQLNGVAKVIDIKQFGRQCITPIVALTFLRIDMYTHGSASLSPGAG
jgi:hypothetical protein